VQVIDGQQNPAQKNALEQSAARLVGRGIGEPSKPPVKAATAKETKVDRIGN
jgi:hypothetical protein